jgi:hypothetical protein
MTTRITPEQQRLIFSRYAKRSAMAVYAHLGTHLNRISDLALHRAMTEGLDEYDDSSYRLDNAQLLNEVDEELSDAIWYMQIRFARIFGEIA